MQDASAKGRVKQGSAHWGAKLTEKDIMSIKDKRLSGLSYNEIAKCHGVAMQTIAKICTGKLWGHLNAN